MKSLTNVKKLIAEESVNINLVTDEFISAIKEFVARGKNEFESEAKKSLIKELDILYQAFFGYAARWAAEQRRIHAQDKNHPDAMSLKKSASQSVKDVEANIEKFAISLLEINAAMGALYDHLQRTRENKDDDRIKWTSDMGVVLKRYIKELSELRIKLNKLTKGRAAIVTAEEHYKKLEAIAQKIFGDKYESALMPMRSALRGGNFNKAEDAITEIGSKAGLLNKKYITELQKAGLDFIGDLKPHMEDLMGSDNKLLYRLSEVNLALETVMKELISKATYVDKYHRPYVQNKLKTLEHSREKLSVIGSIDNLNMLYLQLIKGVAKPLKELKDVKEYEANVINRVNYLLEWQYKDIETQSERNKELLQECHDYFENFAVAEKLLEKYQTQNKEQ